MSDIIFASTWRLFHTHGAVIRRSFIFNLLNRLNYHSICGQLFCLCPCLLRWGMNKLQKKKKIVKQNRKYLQRIKSFQAFSLEPSISFLNTEFCLNISCTRNRSLWLVLKCCMVSLRFVVFKDKRRQWDLNIQYVDYF